MTVKKPSIPNVLLFFLLIICSNSIWGMGAPWFVVIESINTSSDSTSFMIPFSKIGNLIIVKGKVDDKEGNFILDTGCPKLLLNITYFRNYELSNTETERQGIGTNTVDAYHTLIKKFSLNSNQYTNITADLTDLGNIENARGIKVLGLIGIEILQDFEVIIDYDSNLIHMHRINRKNASSYRHDMLKDESQYRVIPFSLMENRIVIEAFINDKKIKLLLDSGAESALLNSKLPNKVFEMISITGRTQISGIGSKKADVLRGSMKNLQIGDLSITDLPVMIANLEKSCLSSAYNSCVDGVLSLEYLSIKRIGINFVTKKLYLWK